jgi:hypothetical protein
MSEVLGLTAIHEAAHAVAGWAIGLPLRLATAASAIPGRLGMCYFEPPDAWYDGSVRKLYDAAVTLVAGQLAEQALARGGDFAGASLHVDWSRGDPDTRGARDLVLLGAGPERERLMRGVVATRARGVLLTRWGAVLQLARELHRRGRQGMVGSEVNEVLLAAGARRIRRAGGG